MAPLAACTAIPWVTTEMNLARSAAQQSGAARIARIGNQFDPAIKQSSDDFPRRLRSERFAPVARGAGDVAVDHFAKKLLFISERCIQARD